MPSTGREASTHVAREGDEVAVRRMPNEMPHDYVSVAGADTGEGGATTGYGRRGPATTDISRGRERMIRRRPRQRRSLAVLALSVLALGLGLPIGDADAYIPGVTTRLTCNRPAPTVPLDGSATLTITNNRSTPVSGLIEAKRNGHSQLLGRYTAPANDVFVMVLPASIEDSEITVRTDGGSDTATEVHRCKGAGTVVVEPSTDIQDGQTVLVHGSGWRPWNLVRVDQCIAGTDTPPTYAQCEYKVNSTDPRQVFVPTGAGGNFQVYLQVRRTIQVPNDLSGSRQTHPYTCDPDCTIQVSQSCDECTITAGAPISLAAAHSVIGQVNGIVDSMCNSGFPFLCQVARAIIGPIGAVMQPPPPPPPTTTTTIPSPTTTITLTPTWPSTIPPTSSPATIPAGGGATNITTDGSTTTTRCYTVYPQPVSTVPLTVPPPGASTTTAAPTTTVPPTTTTTRIECTSRPPSPQG